MNSKNTKDIWKVIHSILNQENTTFDGNVNHINKCFNSTTARVTGKDPVETSDIYCTITMPPEKGTTKQFELQPASTDEVRKIIKGLLNDCSTVYDNIPIFLIKPVAGYISSPLVLIMRNQILPPRFSKNYKMSQICPIPKVNKPEVPADYRPISVLIILSNVYQRVHDVKWHYIYIKR